MQVGLDPEYVLDRMEYYEMTTLIEFLWMKDKSSWEQTRTLGYITAQTQSTKRLTPQSIMEFPWEKEKVEESDTMEEREQIMKEMMEMENKMNQR